MAEASGSYELAVFRPVAFPQEDTRTLVAPSSSTEELSLVELSTSSNYEDAADPEPVNDRISNSAGNWANCCILF